MRLIEVKPKNGWFHATRDEMQKSSANMLAERHCLNALPIYEAFVKLNIYLPRIMHFFMGKNAIKNNHILLDLLLSDETTELFNLIGTDYEKYS
jgi:hypothetical protein